MINQYQRDVMREQLSKLVGKTIKTIEVHDERDFCINMTDGTRLSVDASTVLNKAELNVAVWDSPAVKCSRSQG